MTSNDLDNLDTGLAVMLETNLQLYAWHGRHDLAHITSLRERNGW